jgi:Concanavalin A-like lectin/glucanases superfamily
MKINFNKIQNAALLLLATGLINTSCTKADYGDDFSKGDPPPVPGGFTNSSQVAATNLLAYWNFDGSNNETKSSTAPTVATNASFVTGIKGQALRLNAGYVLYPTISALSSTNAIASCTVSMWVNFANNGSQASEFFALTQAPAAQTDWLTVLNIAAETGHAAGDDNLVFHSWIGSYPGGSRRGGDNINDYGNAGVDFQMVPKANQWVQYIMRYDGVAETIDLFANNIRVSNNNFRVRTGLGPIVCPTPTQVLLGAFPTIATGFPLSGNQSWQALLTGSIDELRVYSKALNDVEISALYQLERQGR